MIPQTDGMEDLQIKCFISTSGNLVIDLYDCRDLAQVNDDTTAGFKRIAKHLIKHADLHFKPSVAKAIKAHFNEND